MAGILNPKPSPHVSKNRIKLSLPLITTRDEAEAVMNDLANTANNRRQLTVRLDAQILAAQNAAAPGLAACDAALQAACDALRAWAESHPEEFPQGRKSLELLSGTLGFRTGTPKLTLLSRAFTWDKVMELLRGKGWSGWIRVKQELDKEAIIAQRDEMDLRAVGLKVTQDESFYVEPKLTDADQN